MRILDNDTNRKRDWYYHFMIEIFGKITGSYSLSWTVAAEQYRVFSDPQYGYTDQSVIQIRSLDGLKYNAKNGRIQKGDLIYFCGEDGNHPHHAAIVTKITEDEIYYNAHTESRDLEPLSAHLDEVVVIIRLKDEA